MKNIEKLTLVLKLICFKKAAEEVGISSETSDEILAHPMRWAIATSEVKLVPEEEWEYRSDRSNLLRIDPIDPETED